MSRLRMAVIGVGHLGKEHARILAGLPEVDLVGVADVNVDQAQAVARRSGTRAYNDHRRLLNLVDAAVVAVPTTHHYAIASEFLRLGTPLLVEKPLALNLRQAEALAESARCQKAILQVGHIERFNPAFEELERLPLQPKFVQCERLGPFSGRSTDIGAVMDLMIHDLDLLLTLVRAPVCSVEALGVAIFGPHEDVANARLVFANGCVANVTASRASANPARCMRVWGPEGYVSLDFMRRRLRMVQPSDQLRRREVDFCPLDPARRALLPGELLSCHLQTRTVDCSGGDQLTRELQHFLHCIQTGSTPRVSGEDGCRAIALATRVLDQIRAHSWQGTADGPAGPLDLPAPRGRLFHAAAHEAA